MKMRKIVFLLVALVLTACSNNRAHREIEIPIVPPTVTKTISNGFEVYYSETTNGSTFEDEDYPMGIIDQPMSESKKALVKSGPAMFRRATWNAALTALKQTLPMPEEEIIFDYSKIERQINSWEECLYTGDFQAKDEKGDYVEMCFTIRVEYFGGDPNDPSSFIAHASVTK